ncbi:MAG: M48 family metallopeptidase [Planctomycetota bacterium]
MNRRQILKVAALCCALLFQSSCTQVAITGRKQLNLVPDSMMNSMALQSYNEFLSANKLSNNAGQTRMVKDVGARIQKAVEKYCAENNLSSRIQSYQWEFNLVEDPNVNAWCMPGGKVVVYTGLLPVTQNEAGLAVVMGHEIAHAIARHGSERMSQGLLVDLGGMALSEALANKPEQTQNLFMKSYGLGTEIGVLLPYSRLHESEADRMGLIFMAMAGFNPNEAVTFWERMSAASKGQAPPEILSTHPADSTRINNIKQLIPEAMQYYKP